MNTMAPTRPTALHQPTRPTAPQKPLRPTVLQKRRVSLAAEPAAAGTARGQVQATIQAWEVPVDASVAMLLTSELVTNAVIHAAGLVITLVVSCSRDQVRVDVHDTSCALPEMADVPADAESGRGLHLVASLAHEWGYYRTTAGKAVYFTLAFGPDPGPRGRRTPHARGR